MQLDGSELEHGGAGRASPGPTRADATRQVSHREVVGLTRELARGGISRRQFLVRAAALGLTTSAIGTVLAACGTGEPEPAASQTIEKVVPEELIFYNWADYLPGISKKNFKKETGITLKETYFDDNEALYAKLGAGATGYDVICPSDYMVHVLIMAGLVTPLDMSLIPRFTNVDPKFQKPSYDPETDGKKYSVPYQWGTTGIGVRLDKVSEPVTSWQTMWDPKYKGQIIMENEMTETIGAALKLLGYSLNSTSEDELTQAGDKLIEQKPLVVAYDTNNMKRNMTQGTPLVHAWNADVLLVMDDIGQDKLGYVLPEEGYTVWIDNLAIPTGANSVYGAHLWMDFICDVKNQADLTDWVWYLSPVPAAYDLIETQLLLDNVPTAEQLDRGEIKDDVGEFNQVYLDTWRRVKSA
jgi:spermidine/putrescine transport system substrate-binding protein